MTNFERFKDFLRGENLNFEENTTDDGINYIRMWQEIENAGTLLIIFDFDKEEQRMTLRMFNIAKISSPLKRDELLRLVNEMNLEYNYMKFIVRDDGEVIMNYTVDVDSSYNYAKMLTIAAVTIEVIKKEMKKFMQLQWS